jgi:hypothetical protein
MTSPHMFTVMTKEKHSSILRILVLIQKMACVCHVLHADTQMAVVKFSGITQESTRPCNNGVYPEIVPALHQYASKLILFCKRYR